MHCSIAENLREFKEFTVRIATLQAPEHGLTVAVLAETEF